MKNIYELDTWRGNSEANKIAIEAAQKYSGKKFTVSIGEWGVKTYLVFAESKESAKEIALNVYDESAKDWHDEKIKVREVTNCKKYQ